MSARSRIVDALVQKLKEINGTGAYQSNLSSNVFNKMIFYDEIEDYPTVCVVAGYESREYLPSSFTWGYLNISVKIYVEDENSQQILEDVIADIEYLVSQNEKLIYDSGDGEQATEILISSIQTDEGVLSPLGVGEVNLTARYQVVSPPSN
jgi:hypothetical protein